MAYLVCRHQCIRPHQCAAIPACDSVKERKAPTANGRLKWSVIREGEKQSARTGGEEQDANSIDEPPPW